MQIIITGNDGVALEKLSTEGYILLYLDSSGTRFHGKVNVDLKALTPVLSKILLEKMAKGS